MPVTSSKDILAKYNFLSTEETKKHAKHEFQAFAYKLAADLNDLVNLKLYMRIARNMDRSLVERAYSFAIDSKSENKGKAFFWKIKDLRLELQKYKDSQNFDYDFVMKKMKTFRTRTLGAQMKVYLESKNSIIKYLIENTDGTSKSKAFIISTPSIELISDLIEKNKKVHYHDLSKDINNKLEAPFLENHKKISFKTTDLLKTKFKENFFNTIIIDSYWNYVPLDAEVKVLNHISQIMHKKGVVFISFKMSPTIKQEWKDLKTGESLLPYFSKLSNLEEIEKAASKFSLKTALVYNDGTYGIARITF